MRLHKNINLKNILDIDGALENTFRLGFSDLNIRLRTDLLSLLQTHTIKDVLFLAFYPPVVVRTVALNSEDINRGYIELKKHKLSRAVNLHVYTQEGSKLKAYFIGEGKLLWLKDSGLKKGHRLTITCKDESNFYRLGEACGLN